MSDSDRRDTLDRQSGDLLDLFRARERNHDLRLRVAIPGQVVTYTAATQTVTVIVSALTVEDRGIPLAVPDPPLQLSNVPVAFLAGMGGLAYDTIPIVPGDTGLLICCDRALDEWRRRGEPCDPVDGRTHSLADAVFLPGLRPTPAVITPPPSLTARVIEAPLINLGVAATDFALQGTTIAAAVTATAAALPAAAVDPATALALANALRLAFIALGNTLTTNLSTKVRIE